MQCLKERVQRYSKETSLSKGRNRYQLNQKITVFYNPDKPDTNYAEGDKPGLNNAILYFGFAFLMFALVVVGIVAGIRKYLGFS